MPFYKESRLIGKGACDIFFSLPLIYCAFYPVGLGHGGGSSCRIYYYRKLKAMFFSGMKGGGQLICFVNRCNFFLTH